MADPGDARQQAADGVANSLREIRGLADNAVMACLEVLPLVGSWTEGYRVADRVEATLMALPEEWANAAYAVAELQAALARTGGEAEERNPDVALLLVRVQEADEKRDHAIRILNEERQRSGEREAALERRVQEAERAHEAIRGWCYWAKNGGGARKALAEIEAVLGGGTQQQADDRKIHSFDHLGDARGVRSAGDS